MGKKLYENTEQGGIRFKSERKPWEVRMPCYVYDIWLPIIGATALAVYGLYCRLERQGTVKAITLQDIANACRIGKATLYKVNEKLERCQFVTVTAPEGWKRLAHYTTEITILDPPQEVSSEIIKELYPEGREYEPLTPWLVAERPEVPASTPNEVPASTPNVETLGLKPLDVVEDASQKIEETGGEENTSVNQDQPVAVSNKNGPDGAEGGTVGEKSEGTIEGGGPQGVVVKDRRPQQKGGDVDEQGKVDHIGRRGDGHRVVDNGVRALEDGEPGSPPSGSVPRDVRGGDDNGRGAGEHTLKQKGEGGEGIRSGRADGGSDPDIGPKTGKPPPWVNAPLPPNSEGGRYLQSRCGWWKGFKGKDQQREFERLERQLTLTGFMKVIDDLLEEGEYHHDVAESVIERAKTAETPQEEEKNDWLDWPKTPDIPTSEWLEWE